MEYYFVAALLTESIIILSFQKILPAIASFVRNASDSTDLKSVLVEKIPKEQERVKNFRKAKGATKVGDVTVDMVSDETNDQSCIDTPYDRRLEIN